MSRKTLSLLLLLALVLTVGLVACQPAAPEESPEEAAPEEAAPEEAAAGTYYERAMAGEFDGTVVTMTGPFTDEDAVKFDTSVAAFEDATGIDVQYEGSKEFEASIGIRVEAGDPPDIVDFPQPGLLATFVAGGHVVDVSTFLPDASFANYNQSWWDMGTMAGPDGPIVAGVWHRFNAKSQVWYPQEEFEAAGYAIPTTWDEMVALSDQIVADGDKPWCVGIESGAATGWPATDWMEEVMLRTTSLENYDKWVTGELPFSSPEVKNALSVLDVLWSEEYVYGGQEAIVTTFFGDAPTPMFEDPPKCWLHKQGNFITSFFPEGVEAGTDYGFFYLPGIDEAYGKPYLVAGDIMAMFNDRDEVRAVMEFFTKGEAVKEWLVAGGALSPHMDTDLDWYGDDIERGIAALVADATSVRFDGSDLMPGEVGAGSFWKGMTDYFAGVADMDTVMAEIDASWPGAAPAEEVEEEAEAAAEPVTFQVFYPVAVDAPIADILNGYIEDFQAEYPYITVEPVFSGGYGDVQTAIQTTIDGGGEPPALAVMLATALYDLINADYVAPLDGYVADMEGGDDYVADFLPAFLANSYYDDQLWSVPFQRSAVVMYYNADMFADAGLEAPTSWQTWAEAAQALTVQEGDAINWGLQFPSGWPYWLFQPLAIGNGQNILDGDCTVVFDDPAVIEAVQFYIDLAAEYEAMPTGVQGVWGTATTDFASGTAAMIVHSSGSLTGILEQADFEVGVMPVPGKEEDTYASVPGGGNFYIMKGAPQEQQDAAWKFVEFISHPGYVADYSINTGYIANRASAYDTEAMQTYTAEVPQALATRDALQYAGAELATQNLGQVRGIFHDYLQRAYNSEMTAAEAMAAAQAEADAALADFCP